METQAKGYGKPCPDPMGGPHRTKLDESALDVLPERVAEQPDRTLQELADKLDEKTGIRVDATTVLRGLATIGLTRKKKSIVAGERNSKRVQKLRRCFERWQDGVDIARLVFIDETGHEEPIGLTMIDGAERHSADHAS